MSPTPSSSESTDKQVARHVSESDLSADTARSKKGIVCATDRIFVAIDKVIDNNDTWRRSALETLKVSV